MPDAIGVIPSSSSMPTHAVGYLELVCHFNPMLNFGALGLGLRPILKYPLYSMGRRLFAPSEEEDCSTLPYHLFNDEVLGAKGVSAHRECRHSPPTQTNSVASKLSLNWTDSRAQMREGAARISGSVVDAGRKGDSVNNVRPYGESGKDKSTPCVLEAIQ